MTDMKLIDLKSPSPDLFDTVAEAWAKKLTNDIRGLQTGKKWELDARNVNKPTQLRKFYNEVLMWEQRVQMNPESFATLLPMIRMLNAKVAYARGRDKVDDNFTDLIQHCVRSVQCPETLSRFRLLFEAILGFHKANKSD